MNLDFTRKNELKARQGILRGVYEENQVLVGKGRHPLSRRRSFSPKRSLIYSVGCLFAFLIYGHYQGTFFSPAELTADMTTYSISPPGTGLSERAPSTSGFTPLVNNNRMPVGRMLGLKIRRIMIDPGHGGSDPGCIGKMGTMEKNITLDIARRLKAHILKDSHYHVRMTREGDSSVPLHKRIAIAQQAKADLFVSIHVNSLPDMPTNVIETYYYGPSNDERTLKLAEDENAGSEYGLSDFKEVVERLGQTMKLQESKEFAASIQANLFLNSRKHAGDIKNYGVKKAPFVVLLGLDVPSVLVEVSCLSNPEEERELNSETHREHIAAYLAAGVLNYLNKGALRYEAKR
jgi:N-acetylmuramoyl-L-alanine amidase